MNILIIFPSCKFNGGATFSLSSLAVELQEQHKANVFAVIPFSYSRHNALKNFLSEHKVSFILSMVPWWVREYDGSFSIIGRQSIRRFIFFLQTALFEQFIERRIRRLIRQKAIDVVYIGDAVMGTGFQAAKSSKVPVVWHIREFMEEDHHWEFVNYSKSLAMLGSANKIVAVSKAVAEKYTKLLDRTIDVVYNGVTGGDDRLTPSTRSSLQDIGGLRLAMIGAVTETKGVLVAVKAVHLLRDRGISDIYLDIYGDVQGDYAKFVERYICEENLTDRVVLHGPTKQVGAVLEKSDALLMCSRSEAFGRVTAEAMCAGVHVIGSRSGGTTELLESYGGQLFTEGSPESLAEAICDYIDDKTKLDIMAKRNSIRANEDFSVRAYTSQMYSIMQTAIA